MATDQSKDKSTESSTDFSELESISTSVPSTSEQCKQKKQFLPIYNIYFFTYLQNVIHFFHFYKNKM